MAQREFAHYRSGNSLYASDPGAINAWISFYDGAYDSALISNANYDLTYSPTTTAETTATVASSVVYQGTTLASGSTSFAINSSSPSCGIGTQCKQF